MAEFRHFCNVLERSDENKWCQKRHRIGRAKYLYNMKIYDFLLFEARK